MRIKWSTVHAQFSQFNGRPNARGGYDWKFNKADRYDCPLRERPHAAPFHLGTSFASFKADPDMRRFAWREHVAPEEPSRWVEAKIRAAEIETMHLIGCTPSRVPLIIATEVLILVLSSGLAAILAGFGVTALVPA